MRPQKSSTASTSAAPAPDRWPRELLRLERNDLNLTSLRITAVRGGGGPGPRSTVHYRPANAEDWRRLGAAIATNTHVRRLDLTNLIKRTPSLGLINGQMPSLCHLDLAFEEFYGNLNKNTSVRRLTLEKIDMYSIGGEKSTSHINRLLENNTSLTSLSATDCNGLNLGFRGESFLAYALARKTTSLLYLDLSGTMIYSGACQELIQVLSSGHARLRSLELNRNSIRNTGCEAIARQLLKNPASMLVRLYLDQNHIHDEGAAALAEGLVGNRRLRTLSVRGNTAITPGGGYAAFSAALCHSPNVEGILLSNHTVERLGANRDGLSAELQSSLRFNRAANKRRAANRKVVMHHLVYNCNIDLMETVPGGLLPSVLAMIADHGDRSTGKNDRTDADARNHYSYARNDYKIRHSALHRIVRLCPSVCERHAISTIDGKLSSERKSVSKMSSSNLCG